jgi:glycosyltransferase involved in cell wall biosynthesis
MGTVPVALESNRFAEAMDEEHGAVAVDSMEAMVGRIRELLEDPARVERLSVRARAWARAHLSWPEYARVDGALAKEDTVEPTAESRAWVRSITDAAEQRAAARR